MNPFLLSLAAGSVIGVLYGLLKVRSPAPPVIALVGLLGMLLGGALIDAILPAEQPATIQQQSFTRPVTATTG